MITDFDKNWCKVVRRRYLAKVGKFSLVAVSFSIGRGDQR